MNLEPTTLELQTYIGETVRPTGVYKVKMEYQDQVRYLQLHVLLGKGPDLFEHKWLQEIQLR